MLRRDGFRFAFFSNEGHPREPRHVHVSAGEPEAKIWPEPEIAIGESCGLNARELNRRLRIANVGRGRTLGVPFAWFPRRLNATPEQRQRVEIGRMGLHWEDLDEDIRIAELLAGRGDRTKSGRRERKRAADSAA